MLQRITFDTSRMSTINLPGAYVAYVSGSAGTNSAALKIKPENGGSEISLSPGMDATYPVQSTAWRIEPEQAGAVVTGELIIGVGRINDRRITGSVTVADTLKATSIAGQAYWGGAHTIESPSPRPVHAIENPTANTTRRIVLKRWRVRIDSSLAQVGGLVVIGGWEPAATSMDSGPLGAAFQGSKLGTGGAPSAAALAGQGIVLPNYTTTIFAESMRAGDSVELIQAEPIIIPAGRRLRIHSYNTQCTLTSHWEWVEEVV